MHHTRTREVTVTERFITCDRCGREMQPDDPEYQEHVALRFRAGYGSVFDDGSLVAADFCQHCVQAVLVPWLRVTPDDPFDPRHAWTDSDRPKGAGQPGQLARTSEGEALRAVLRKRLGPLQAPD